MIGKRQRRQSFLLRTSLPGTNKFGMTIWMVGQAFTDAYVDENRKEHRDVQDAYNRAAYKKQLYGQALDNSMQELNRTRFVRNNI